jgi:hypothetical protein
LVCQLAEANTADAEFSVHGPRAAAQLAAALVLNLGVFCVFAIFDLLAT